MTGIIFLAALIGIFVVVMWEITNDRVGLTEETGGLLRMPKEELVNSNPKQLVDAVKS